MSWTTEQIESVFRSHFHRLPKRVEIISHGLMNFTYEVEIDGAAYILKIYPASRFGIAVKQFKLLKSIESEPIKVPRVLFAGSLHETSFLVYGKIPGETLAFERHQSVDRRSISQQIANNIKALSAVSVKGAGSLTEDEDSFPDWRSFLAFQILDGFKNLQLPGRLVIPDLKKIEASMRKISGELKPVALGLVWSDFSQDNIIVYHNRLSGFIDFEGCFAGDPLLSLGYLYAREGESDFYLAMETAFQNIFEVEKSYIYFYAVLRLLRISKYLSEPMPNGQERGSVWSYFRGLKTALRLITA